MAHLERVLFSIHTTWESLSYKLCHTHSAIRCNHFYLNNSLKILNSTLQAFDRRFIVIWYCYLPTLLISITFSLMSSRLKKNVFLSSLMKWNTVKIVTRNATVWQNSEKKSTSNTIIVIIFVKKKYSYATCKHCKKNHQIIWLWIDQLMFQDKNL